jgi:hypothetical protein
MILKSNVKKEDRLKAEKSVSIHGKRYAISDGDRAGNPLLYGTDLISFKSTFNY